jgi:hypothetical protein
VIDLEVPDGFATQAPRRCLDAARRRHAPAPVGAISLTAQDSQNACRSGRTADLVIDMHRRKRQTELCAPGERRAMLPSPRRSARRSTARGQAAGVGFLLTASFTIRHDCRRVDKQETPLARGIGRVAPTRGSLSEPGNP